jgi:hypothetical protein
MTTLATAKPRDYLLGDLQDLPMIAADIIYEGAAVGENGSGYFRPLVAADPFAGFAERTVDNSAGAAGAVNVRVKPRGRVILPVVGVTAVTDEGATVYASDDDTFTLTATGNSAIGKITRYISGTTVEVYYEAASFRSL